LTSNNWEQSSATNRCLWGLLKVIGMATQNGTVVLKDSSWYLGRNP
jgi:hypothetical protein